MGLLYFDLELEALMEWEERRLNNSGGGSSSPHRKWGRRMIIASDFLTPPLPFGNFFLVFFCLLGFASNFPLEYLSRFLDS